MVGVVILYKRVTEDGVELTVYRMIFNDRICVGEPGAPTYDRAFCFPQDGSAQTVAETWDGENDPPGPWVKESGTDRYREKEEAKR